MERRPFGPTRVRVAGPVLGQRHARVAVGQLQIEAHFAAGEAIHTEDSHKYTIEEFHALAAEAGWRAFRHWTDPDDLFSIHYLRVD